MDTTILRDDTQDLCEPSQGELERLAPRPLSIAESGLSQNLLEELAAKHLYEGGVMDMRELISRTALTGPVLEEIFATMRRNTYVQIHGPAVDRSALRFGLTDRGRAFAAEALLKSGYCGPAPVPIERYTQVVNAQSIHRHQVSQTQMHQTFSDTVISATLLDQLGAAMHSGRPIFMYGAAGTGKTYMGQRLAWLLHDAVLVPHAIALGDSVIQLFDPLIHRPINPSDNEPNVMLQEGFDLRFTLCHRPAVVSGGELTLDMLEIQYQPASRQYHAPVQLKANNGIYMIDDLGRQRVAPVDLFNRWIVPMESRQDYLSLQAGKRLPVPFDVILIFSTNLNPRDLADDAFLRRLGHKIRFDYLRPEEYTKIWLQVCGDRSINFDPEVLDFVLNELHATHKIPLLPCHPRDLLGMALDYSRYLGGSNRLTKKTLEVTWNNYFVNTNVTIDDSTNLSNPT
jgi:predicted ATPase with chaperone activity